MWQAVGECAGYTIWRGTDAEGRRCWAISRVGREPSGAQVYTSRQAAEESARWYRAESRALAEVGRA